MAEIVTGIPATISALQEALTFIKRDVAFTLSIADLPFMQENGPQAPYLRDTADWRKQQFDNSREAGEQSLDQAQWVRSQNSFHRGAGVNFYEPGADQATEFRFKSSAGVNVWTQGQVTLLHSLTNVAASAGYAGATGARVGGADYAFVNLNGTLKRVASDGVTTGTYTGLAAAVGDPVVASGNVLIGSTTGIWAGPAATPGALTHQLTTTGASVRIWKAKQRLVVSHGVDLYTLAFGDTALPGSPLYTHPDSGWTWTSVTETTDAILAAGYANGAGAIYRFSLEDPGGGGTPVLSSAFQIAEMPPGEEVYSIMCYLGAFIAIGTSRGVRIGAITGSTSISPTVIHYGPLLFMTTQPVTALTAADRFVYAGVNGAIDGSSGVARISLDAEIPNTTLQFPWAYDVNTHAAGSIDALSLLGSSGRLVVGLHSTGVFYESTTAYELEGYIRTGGIRYATVENKQFRRANIRAVYPAATGVQLQTIAPNGAAQFIVGLDGASAADSDLPVTRPTGLWEYLGFEIKLTGDGTATPTLSSYQIKAIPAPKKQRLITYNVRIADHPMDVNGAAFGGDGFAAACILALEALESATAVMRVVDGDTGEAYEGTIDHLRFVRESNRQKADPNFGGICQIVMRKL